MTRHFSPKLHENSAAAFLLAPEMDINSKYLSLAAQKRRAVARTCESDRFLMFDKAEKKPWLLARFYRDEVKIPWRVPTSEPDEEASAF